MMENLIDNQSFFNMELYGKLEELGSGNEDVSKMREMILVEASVVSEIVSNYEKLQATGGDTEQYDNFYKQAIIMIEERNEKVKQIESSENAEVKKAVLPTPGRKKNTSNTSDSRLDNSGLSKRRAPVFDFGNAGNTTQEHEKNDHFNFTTLHPPKQDFEPSKHSFHFESQVQESFSQQQPSKQENFELEVAKNDFQFQDFKKRDSPKKFDFDFGSSKDSEKEIRSKNKKTSIQNHLENDFAQRFTFNHRDSDLKFGDERNNKFGFNFGDSDGDGGLGKSGKSDNFIKEESLRTQKGFEFDEGSSEQIPKKLEKSNPYPSLSSSHQESKQFSTLKKEESSFRKAQASDFMKKSEEPLSERSKKDDFLAFSNNFGDNLPSDRASKIDDNATSHKKEDISSPGSNPKMTFSGAERAFKIQRQDSQYSQQNLNFEDFADINPDDFKSNFNFEISEKNFAQVNDDDDSDTFSEGKIDDKESEDDYVPEGNLKISYPIKEQPFDFNVDTEDKYNEDMEFNFDGLEQTHELSDGEDIGKNVFNFELAEENLRKRVSTENGFEIPDNAFNSVSSFKEAFDFGGKSGERGIGETDNIRKSEFFFSNRKDGGVENMNFETMNAFSDTNFHEKASHEKGSKENIEPSLQSQLRIPDSSHFSQSHNISNSATIKDNQEIPNNSESNIHEKHEKTRSSKKSQRIITNEPVQESSVDTKKSSQHGNSRFNETASPTKIVNQTSFASHSLEKKEKKEMSYEYSKEEDRIIDNLMMPELIPQSSFEIKNEVLILKDYDTPPKNFLEPESKKEKIPEPQSTVNLEITPIRPKNFEKYQVSSVVQESDEFAEITNFQSDEKFSPLRKKKQFFPTEKPSEKFYEEMVIKSINDTVFLTSLLNTSSGVSTGYETIFKRPKSIFEYSPSKERISVFERRIQNLRTEEISKIAKEIAKSVSYQKEKDYVKFRGKNYLQPNEEVFSDIFHFFNNNGDNLDNFRYCSLSGKGILFENTHFSVGFASEKGLEAENGQMMFHFQIFLGNKIGQDTSVAVEIEENDKFIHYENDFGEKEILLREGKALKFAMEFSTDNVAPESPGILKIKYSNGEEIEEFSLMLPFITTTVLNALYATPEILKMKWQRLKKASKFVSGKLRQNEKIIPEASDLSRYFEFATESHSISRFSAKAKEFYALMNWRKETVIMKFTFYKGREMKVSSASLEKSHFQIIKAISMLFSE